MSLSKTSLPNTSPKSQLLILMFLCAKRLLHHLYVVSVRLLYIYVPKFRSSRACFCLKHTFEINLKKEVRPSMFLCARKIRRFSMFLLSGLLYIKTAYCTTDVLVCCTPCQNQIQKLFVSCFSASKDCSILSILLSAFYMSKEPVPQNHVSVFLTTPTLSSKVQVGRLMFLWVKRSLNTRSYSVHLLYIKLLLEQRMFLESKTYDDLYDVSLRPKITQYFIFFCPPSTYQKYSSYNGCFWSPNHTILAPCFSASKYWSIFYVLLSAFYISKYYTTTRMFLESKSHNSCTMFLCVQKSLNTSSFLSTFYISKT
jgi:hypothetical protein